MSLIRRFASGLTRRSPFAMPTLCAALRFNATVPSAAPHQQQQQQQLRRRPGGPNPHLPPSFDIPRWNEDKTKGFCLRVSYQENSVVLSYLSQKGDLNAPSESGRQILRGDRLVSVYLPSVYLARFLSVLEGASNKVEIGSRHTTGTFSVGTEPNTFKLQCKSNVNGKDTLEWGIDFDVANAVMLHRFITQSLHFNNGFVR